MAPEPERAGEGRDPTPPRPADGTSGPGSDVDAAGPGRRRPIAPHVRGRTRRSVFGCRICRRRQSGAGA